MSPRSQVLFQYLQAEQIEQIRCKILDIGWCQSKVCCKYYFGVWKIGSRCWTAQRVRLWTKLQNISKQNVTISVVTICYIATTGWKCKNFSLIDFGLVDQWKLIDDKMWISKRSVRNIFYPYLSTVHRSDVAVLILASLTVLFLITTCELSVDASVLCQRTAYQF